MLSKLTANIYIFPEGLVVSSSNFELINIYCLLHLRSNLTIRKQVYAHSSEPIDKEG
jgi:hypothetical protein